MATLTAKRRRALPASDFAYPATRSYPIDTIGRARAALSRAAQKGTKGTYRHVARKVRAKYGDRVATVGPTKGTTARPGLAKRRRSTSRPRFRRGR